ncbi:hypothetical protein FRC08_004241 [Ceratobasidium sp. 394]|nr:hypothetical protein FRC08_004241 [Ceratobasidium sp. 394]
MANKLVLLRQLTSTSATLRYKLGNTLRMAPPEFDQDLLDKLFPAPSFASAFTSPFAPTPNAGITPESTAALQRLLKENHQRFHVFFNDRRFHNHLSHHLFAAYGIGAPPSVLQAAFDEHASYQRPAYKSPEKVTSENWTKFLGNEDYYNSYMGFFNDEIQTHGLASTFERYIFSQEANWTGDEPRMLDRFVSGLLHPLIHFGHAAEFGVPGMAIEGLSQAAVHKPAHTKLFDAKFFSSDSDSYLSNLTSTLSLTSSTKPKSHTHIFTILARALADSRLEAGQACRFESATKYSDTLDSTGDIIREYVELWTVDEDENVIRERVEELQWFVTTAFGLGGWKKDKRFKADFFLAHLVTSDLFIPSILSLLKPANQVTLLRAYFAVCLGLFVSRGRPALDIEGFFEYTSLDPKPPSGTPEKLPAEAKNNPWYTVLTYTIPHKDEHHVKAERALAHGAALYGARPKGWFKDTELKDADKMDGSLFVRTGGLLMEVMNWEVTLGIGEKKTTRSENDLDSTWDRAGLGWNEAWE